MPRSDRGADAAPLSAPLREAVAASGLGVVDLARQSGVNRESLRKWLKGEGTITLESADGIARAVSVKGVRVAAPKAAKRPRMPRGGPSWPG